MWQMLIVPVLEDWVVHDIMNHPDMWFLTCVPDFSSIAWFEVFQDLPVLDGHTLRTLMVPDQVLGGQSSLIS